MEVAEERLGRSYSGIRRGTTHFDVTIARLRTMQVFVIGEVAQPSAYQLSSVATVLNGLYAAGGPTELANFRQIQVQRGNQVLARWTCTSISCRARRPTTSPSSRGTWSLSRCTVPG